jgi:hypothetical protein
MRYNVIFALCFYFARNEFVYGDNIPKPNLRNPSRKVERREETKGFANFRPIPELSSSGRPRNGRKTGEQRSEVLTKDNASFENRLSTNPRTRSELERGHLSSVQQRQNQEKFTKQRKLEVRNLTVQRCGNGGTQYVVECSAGTEEYCHRELRKAHAVIVNELPHSDFFVVCVDTDEEKELLKSLTDVVDLEEDYVRSLSYLPELTKPVHRRELQGGGQATPYGVTMVNAPQFWQSRGDKGGSAKVCIIDTGLYRGHEDMQGATVSGSTSNEVVADWDSDDAGHGKFLWWIEI